jgi:hypothetical protein
MTNHRNRNYRKAILASALVGLAVLCWPTSGTPVSAQDPAAEPVREAVPAVATTAASHAATVAERDTVSVIGDSITYLSQAAIHAALDPAFSVEVNGIPGIQIAGQQEAVRQSATASPDVVIINLGSNDVGAQREPAEVIRELDQTTSRFGPETCVVLVTLTTHVPSADFRQRAAVVNSWIRNHPHVADWDSALAPTDHQLTTDTVHPNAEGQAVMAQLLAQQVDACTAS